MKAPLPESKHAGVGDTDCGSLGVFRGSDSGSFFGYYGCRGDLLIYGAEMVHCGEQYNGVENYLGNHDGELSGG